MSKEIPKMAKQWRVTGYDGLDALKFTEEAIPIISDNQVLVKSKRRFPQSSYRGMLISGTSPGGITERMAMLIMYCSNNSN